MRKIGRLAARGFLAGVALLTAGAGPSAPPPASDAPLSLTVDELFAWRARGPLADDGNIARVKLARRFIEPGPGADRGARQDPNARVLIAPDGMNDFAGFLAPQPKFNLYTFTHWAQVDVLAWFGGSSQQSILIPSRPWVDAAHRNGVKVIGTIFFAPVAWGGNPTTVEKLLREDRPDHFPAADRLVAIARHYGFDGWLINQETGVSPEAARRMQRFTAYLTRIAPRQMEVHWYDAMLPDGRVRWQNALTSKNAPLFQSGRTRVSDAMFLNYQWTPAGLRDGAALARSIGRDPYSLFIGADLWPDRTNAQAAFRNRTWLRDVRDPETGRALGSIALFAPSFNFNAGGEFGNFRANPADVSKFYDAEVRLFAGDDRNMASHIAEPNSWDGIASLIPARSTITKLPFETGFNTGHGLQDVRDGKTVGGPWHDMSRQDLLPSWQFAYTPGARLEIGYDFQQAFGGGSSLRVAPAPNQRSPIVIPLFASSIQLSSRTGVDVAAITDSAAYSLVLDMSDGTSRRLLLRQGHEWNRQGWCLPTAGKRLRRISIVFDGSDETPKPLNLGRIRIAPNCRSARA